MYASAIVFQPTPRTYFGRRGVLGGERIFYLSIIHHEIGHSRYGEGLNATSTVGIPPASGGGNMNELLMVDRYENPVRLMYGYAPRTSYFGGGGLQGCSIYFSGASCQP